MANRIDKEMVDREIVLTRSQAKMLIEQGDVYCNDKQVLKSGQKVTESDVIEVKDRTLYVSRGAYKLEKAIEKFKLDFNNKVVADVGASTGGFTQVSLQAGARKVYAIDVGHDQLSPLVENDERVTNIEGHNIKEPVEIDELADFCVVDISFISLRLVFHNIEALLKPGGKAVLLIKPQFEAGKERMGRGGLIKDGVREEVLQEVLDWFKENNYNITECIPSPIVGNKSGNTEYLALYVKN